ncbi:hypothetical protein OAD06_05465 [Flavobacteriaceae bacterium]|jgi:hypothetical protein|nr:hypothetical protein [bacterium]MDB9913731.1 hypothetical protein [Flavobacteriaceae bacterium]|tara:strand:+ start:1033 stop:1626 length:594 start_codon:yes stop_codon:yes gene_type:complete
MATKIKYIIFSVVLISIFIYLDDDHSKKIDTSKYNKESDEENKLINNEESKKFILRKYNGHSPYDAYFGKGIYNNWTENSFIIKNSNQTDAVVLLVNAISGKKIRNEYIRKGTTFEMTGVPNGTYYLEWFSGSNWSDDLVVTSKIKGGFQRNANFTKVSNRNDWMRVEGYQNWTLTLYSVAGGDVESKNISAEDFFN